MSTYRKRPVVIEAFQWTGRNVVEMTTWASHVDLAAKRNRGLTVFSNHEQQLPLELVSLGDDAFDLEVRTLEGIHKANHGDWIICGVHGEFYPCKPDIFTLTYEAVDAPIPTPPTKRGER